KVLKKLSSFTLKLVKKLHNWIHARLQWICLRKTMRIINGSIITLLGAFLALPLPIPFSNVIAAWAVVFMALGLLKEDGLFVLIGYLFFLGTIAFCFFIPLIIKEVV